jgi:uncharacterized protein
MLLASVDEEHVAYRSVHAWLRGPAAKTWATCALTESAFVRILSNPAFHKHPVSLTEAIESLQGMTSRPEHRFWPMDLTFLEAMQPFQERLVSHGRVTDAYLLGLAIKNRGQLVTLDRGIAALAGAEFGRYVTVLR